MYSVKYPISVTIADGTKTTVTSDAELQAAISASLKTEETIALAAQNRKKVETILVNGKFKVDSYVNAGVNSATNYKDFTIDFANNLSVTAVNSEYNSKWNLCGKLGIKCFSKTKFSGNASFTLLNNTWK
jgi:hypothetical protein